MNICRNSTKRSIDNFVEFSVGFPISMQSIDDFLPFFICFSPLLEVGHEDPRRAVLALLEDVLAGVLVDHVPDEGEGVPKLLMNSSSSPNFDELMNLFIKNWWTFAPFSREFREIGAKDSDFRQLSAISRNSDENQWKFHRRICDFSGISATFWKNLQKSPECAKNMKILKCKRCKSLFIL